MTVSNESKSTVFSPSNEAKNVITFTNEGQPGKGWVYDQSNLNYDSISDSITGLPVYYDALGTLPAFTNESKNNV